MSIRKFHKVTTLPTTKDANAFYAVQNWNDVDYYLTDSSWVAKTIVNDLRITDLIDTAFADQNNVEVVDDITARDALTLTKNETVLVLDATADATVGSWAATYVYKEANTTWYKISEHESLDVVINWADIQNKPTSSVTDIDDAVNKKHAHNNFPVLQKLTEDGNWELEYDWEKLNSWNTLDW